MSEPTTVSVLFKTLTEILRCEAAMLRRMRGIRGILLTRKMLKLEAELADAKASMHMAKVASVVGMATPEELEAARDVVIDIKRQVRAQQRKISSYLAGIDEHIMQLKLYYNFLLDVAVSQQEKDLDDTGFSPFLHVITEDRQEADPSSQDLDELMKFVPLWGPSADGSFMN